MQALDPLPILGIGLQSLYTSTGAGDAKTLEEALVAKVAEARNRAPSVLYLPDYHTWMDVSSPALRTCLEAAIGALPASAPVLLLAHADTSKVHRSVAVVCGGCGRRVLRACCGTWHVAHARFFDTCVLQVRLVCRLVCSLARLLMYVII